MKEAGHRSPHVILLGPTYVKAEHRDIYRDSKSVNRDLGMGMEGSDS